MIKAHNKGTYKRCFSTVMSAIKVPTKKDHPWSSLTSNKGGRLFISEYLILF